ncbi:MAG: hypothetical protein JOY81_12825 [Alphaproteobacteria bacterium]|nr:hypothetical protein [Alphaproteobacteria bacterium]
MTDPAALGREAARQLRAQYGNVDIDTLAGLLGVTVEIVDADGGFGTVVVFADYTPRPPRVRLYRPALAALDARLAGYPDRDLLPQGTRPVFLAHELFHHWEALHPEQAPPARDRSEAAAVAFAQAWLGLCHSPDRLDRLMVPVR